MAVDARMVVGLMRLAPLLALAMLSPVVSEWDDETSPQQPLSSVNAQSSALSGKLEVKYCMS